MEPVNLAFLRLRLLLSIISIKLWRMFRSPAAEREEQDCQCVQHEELTWPIPHERDDGMRYGGPQSHGRGDVERSGEAIAGYRGFLGSRHRFVASFGR